MPNPNTHDRAFPISVTSHDDNLFDSLDAKQGGLTKREYIAASSLQGLLANLGSGRDRIDVLVTIAVDYADKLLAELEKNND